MGRILNAQVSVYRKESAARRLGSLEISAELAFNRDLPDPSDFGGRLSCCV